MTFKTLYRAERITAGAAIAFAIIAFSDGKPFLAAVDVASGVACAVLAVTNRRYVKRWNLLREKHPHLPPLE